MATKRTRKVKLLKVEEVEPGKHIVQLEVHGAPDLPTETALPEEPLELSEPAPKGSWLGWLKKLF